MPYKDRARRRDYDKERKRRQRAADLVLTEPDLSGQQFFAKKEPDLALFENGVYIVRLDSFLY